MDFMRILSFIDQFANFCENQKLNSSMRCTEEESMKHFMNSGRWKLNHIVSFLNSEFWIFFYSADPDDPGGVGYARHTVYPDYLLDTWHPLERAQYPDYFAKRDQRKQEYIERWHQKYGPEKNVDHWLCGVFRQTIVCWLLIINNKLESRFPKKSFFEESIMQFSNWILFEIKIT